MSTSNAERKKVLLSVRITREAKAIVEIEASKDGVTISEWIRNLIIKELSERELASKIESERKEGSDSLRHFLGKI